MHSSLVLAFAGLAFAHFKLLNPESFHFEDATEDQAPCGGRIPEFPSNDDDLFQYHIGGEDIATQLTHERSAWLIRVTTDEKASKDWEQVYPIYTQSGLGSFCIPRVGVPEKYEGKKGIVSLVSAATDGILYQCAIVKFVSGTGEDFGKCTNGSATGYFDSNDRLSALVGDDADSNNSSSETSGGATTTSGSNAEQTNSDNGDEDDGAMSLQAWGLLSSLLTLGAMAVGGGASLM
ncbi:hypothetical protein CC79DRAFT_2230 [Sarocladium strictum]